MAWNEDAIHRWLARLPRPQVLCGTTGHDSAVLRTLKREPVVCVDACIEGVHFEHGTAARLAGSKAARRSLSDLAASAAQPRALLLSLRAPREKSAAWIRAAISGVRSTGLRYGAELVGGDLAMAEGPAQLCVTAIGERAARGPAPGRSRLRPGDIIWVSGSLGGSILGRHLRFEPRIEWGIKAERCGAHALMDVSDGLCLDLHRMARLAGVRIRLDLASVPVHRDARALPGRALEHALHDGEDHELLIGAPETAARRLERELPMLVRIARVERGSGLLLQAAGLRARRFAPREGGWIHGA